MIRTKNYYSYNSYFSYLSVIHCGFTDREPNERFGPKTNDHYVINYIKQGKGTYVIDGNAYPLEAGHIFFIFPGHGYYHQADEEDPWVLSWVGFSGTMLPNFFLNTNVSSTNPILKCENPIFIDKQLDSLCQLNQNNISSELERIGILHIILSAIIKDTCTEINTPSNEENNHPNFYIQKAVNYIETHYTENITVTEISNHVGLEKSYLSKLFKSISSGTLYAYLSRLRVYKAASILTNTTIPINRIGYSVGLNDPFHFSKIFKRYMGESPSDYRKRTAVKPNKS